jgi:hypothetical protein
LVIPCKTAAGHAELVHSERRLSQRHRSMLWLVDGQRPIEEVLRLGLQSGLSRGYLDELLALGLVVLAAPMVAATEFHESGPGAVWHDADSARDPRDPLDTIGLGPAVSNTQLARFDDNDLAFAEARSVLTQALLMRAPVSGAVTILRVRRARNRADLRVLLPEVHARLARPKHIAEARQLVSRIERLLAG